MVSNKQLKDILESNGRHYSDEQVKKIRVLLNQMVEIVYSEAKNEQHNVKGSNLRKGINR